MKITDEYLKVQAYLDGELTAGEARLMKSRLESDPSLKELYEELNFASGLFAPGNEMRREVPLPRNAYWAGVRDAIDASLPPSVSKGGIDWKPLLQKLRIPAIGITALLLLSLFVTRGPGPVVEPEFTAQYIGYSREVVTAPNASTMSYYAEDQEMSVTVIHCEKVFLP